MAVWPKWNIYSTSRSIGTSNAQWSKITVTFLEILHVFTKNLGAWHCNKYLKWIRIRCHPFFALNEKTHGSRVCVCVVSSASAFVSGKKSQCKSFTSTLENWQFEPKVMDPGVQIMFLFNWVIFRFQPFIFAAVKLQMFACWGKKNINQAKFKIPRRRSELRIDARASCAFGIPPSGYLAWPSRIYS